MSRRIRTIARLIFFLTRMWIPLKGRDWAPCIPVYECCTSGVKPPMSKGKEWAVPPLGYPYGNDFSTRPYLAPFARESRYQFGQPFTFGYVAVESKPERRKSWRAQQREARRCES